MNRKSVSFARGGKPKSKTKGRRTESSLAEEDDEDQRDPYSVLFETLMSDPDKRAMVLQLLSSQKDAIEEYKRKEQEELRAATKSPMHKLKRNLVLESPTALLRRRALEQRTIDFRSSSSESSTPSPSPVEFGKLLEGVKVFVDVRSKNEDRSPAVKAKLQSMGADVKDEFTKSVSHVVFKDGSFQTYHKAKLLKKHLVSVLWVETVQTLRSRVPEHNYPALGIPSFEKNVSLICEKMQEDYNQVLKDEMSRSFNMTNLSQRQAHSSKKHRQTTLPSEFYFAAKSTLSESQPGTSKDIIPGSEDMEVAGIFSAGQKKISSTNLPKTPDSCLLPGSDSDSHCGVIDGESFSKNKSSESSTLLPLTPTTDGTSTATGSESSNLSPVKCDGDNQKETTNEKENEKRTFISQIDVIYSKFPNISNVVKGSPFVTRRQKTNTRSPKKFDNKENKSKNKDVEPKNISEQNLSNNVHDINTKSKFNDKFITKRRTRLNSKVNRDLDLYLEENLHLEQPAQDQNKDEVPKQQTDPRESLESNATSNSEDMSSVRRTRKSVAVLNSEEFKVPGNRRNSQKIARPLFDTSTIASTSEVVMGKNVSTTAEEDAAPKQQTNPRESLESNATSKSEDMSAVRRTRKSLVDEFKVPVNRRSSSQKIVPPRLSDTSTIVSKSEDVIGKRVSTNSAELSPLQRSCSTIELSLKVDSDIPSQSKTSLRSFSSLSSTSGSFIKDVIEELDHDISNKSGKLMNTSKTRTSIRRTPKNNQKNENAGTKSDTSLINKKVVVERRMSTKNITKKKYNVDTESNQSEDIHISDASSEQNSIESDDSIIADTQEEEPKNTKNSTKPKNSTTNLSALANEKSLETSPRRSTRLSVMKPHSNSNSAESSQSIDNSIEIEDKEERAPKNLEQEKEEEEEEGTKENTPRKSIRNSKLKTTPESESITQKNFKAPEGHPRRTLRKKIDRKSTNVGLLTSDESDTEAVKRNTKPKTKRKSKELLTSDESESESKRKRIQPESKDKNVVEASQNDKSKEHPGTPNNNTINSSSDSSGQKRRRKLFNPNASMESIVKSKILKDVNNESQVKKKPECTKSAIIFTESALKYKNIDHEETQAEIILDLIGEASELASESELNIPKKKPKKAVAQKKIVINPDLDEQTSLLNEVLDKRTPRKQRKADEADSLPIKPYLNRRSTMDFMPKQTPTPKKTPTQRSRVRKPSIVCTRFHRNEVMVFQQIVRKLGGFTVENDVVENTTHLVAGESSRTINILRAMAKGIWILRAEWLYRSLENGKWLPEEEYELTEFNPAVQQCRIQQQTFGSKYTMDIFQKCGAIYVTKNTSPKSSDLEELIKMCKGNLARNARVADIVVGEFLQYDNVTCVKELWVLDSITFNRCKNVINYKIEPRRSDHF